ncbi:MAG: hypothetical protein ACU0C9_00360 [Paracoccaceae bacterium]
MNNDFILVLGVIIGAMAFPSLLSAFSASRPPRAALLLLVVGGALVSWAVYQQPNTYSVEDVPKLFLEVIGKFLR